MIPSNFACFSPGRTNSFPQYFSCKVPNATSERKFTIELLLQLYPEYIKLVKPLNFCGLDILKGFEGNHKKLLLGKPGHVKSGISFHQAGSGFFNEKSIASRLQDAGAIVPTPYLFSTFTNLVLSDLVDLDEFPSFRNHCEPHSAELQSIKQILKHRVKEGFNAITGGGGLGMDAAGRKKREEANHAMGQLKIMLNDPNVSQQVAVQAFIFLRERSLVKASVIPTQTKEELCRYYASDGRVEDEEEESKYGVKWSDLVKSMPESFEEYEAKKKAKTAEKRKKKDAKSGAPGSPDINQTVSIDSDNAPNSSSKAAQLKQTNVTSPLRVVAPTIADSRDAAVADITKTLESRRVQSKEQSIAVSRKRSGGTQATKASKKGGGKQPPKQGDPPQPPTGPQAGGPPQPTTAPQAGGSTSESNRPYNFRPR